jgi:HAMP domain-containing protein
MGKIKNQNQAEMLEKQKQEALKNIKKTAEEAAQGKAQEIVNEKLNEVVSKFDNVSTKEEVEALKADFYKQVQEIQARIKQIKQTGIKEKAIKSIHDAIANAIEEGADKLKNFSGKDKLILKAITDTSWTPTGVLERQTTEVRTSLYNSPYSPLYLRNIFPNVSTDQASVVIPQAGAITGGANVWNRGDGTTPKPEISPTYTDITVPMKWIAGFTTVNRELLMNVRYLQSSITNTLLYSRNGLFAAENNMIIDYITANAPDYATDFGGSKTIGVEMILDAAFNILLGNYMNPTHVLMNPSDYLTYIKLNKAAGSGEYDLPNDLLRGFAGTNLETTVQVVPVPTLVAGIAYVVSAPEFEFISRLAPEIKVSEEHADNFAYNKVSFRVEEMAGFVAKDLNAMVKIGLPPIVPPTGA